MRSGTCSADPRLRLLAWSLVVAATVLGPSSVPAQEAPVLDWQLGPMTAPIGGSLAQIELPEGYVFLDKENTETLLTLLENPLTGKEMATVASASDDEQWFLFFEWDPIGWVDDSEKDDLDADAMLKAIRKGTEMANEERRERGWATMEILGWQEEPHYNAMTNNLTWAINGRSEGAPVINRLVKLLGRRGVMTVILVCSPEELALASLESDALLDGYSFQTGSRYAEYLPGKDTVAKVGLTALVVGGGAAALVKSGFLARFWKLLVVGAAGIAAWLKRLFSGRKQKETVIPPSA